MLNIFPSYFNERSSKIISRRINQFSSPNCLVKIQNIDRFRTKLMQFSSPKTSLLHFIEEWSRIIEKSWPIWKRREICFLVVANPTTLRGDVTGVLLTKRFAQPALTWVLSLCIIYLPRFDRRVFVFGTAMTTTLRDIVHSLLKPSLWLFRTDRSPFPLLLLEFVEIRDVSLPRRDFCVASR